MGWEAVRPAELAAAPRSRRELRQKGLLGTAPIAPCQQGMDMSCWRRYPASEPPEKHQDRGSSVIYPQPRPADELSGAMLPFFQAGRRQLSPQGPADSRAPWQTDLAEALFGEKTIATTSVWPPSLPCLHQLGWSEQPRLQNVTPCGAGTARPPVSVLCPPPFLLPNEGGRSWAGCPWHTGNPCNAAVSHRPLRLGGEEPTDPQHHKGRAFLLLLLSPRSPARMAGHS